MVEPSFWFSAILQQKQEHHEHECLYILESEEAPEPTGSSRVKKWSRKTKDPSNLALQHPDHLKVHEKDTSVPTPTYIM